MEARRQFMGEKRDAVRFVRLRRLKGRARILRQCSYHVPFAIVGQEREVRLNKRVGGEVKVGKGRVPLSQDASDARMRVLDIENRIVLALLNHFRQVEVERG